MSDTNLDDLKEKIEEMEKLNKELLKEVVIKLSGTKPDKISEKHYEDAVKNAKNIQKSWAKLLKQAKRSIR